MSPEGGSSEAVDGAGAAGQDVGRAAPNQHLHNVVAEPSLTIFPPRREAQRTICVLGTPRGGTSMIAGILRKIGIVMGDDIDEANNEDRSFLVHGGVRAIFFKPERTEEKARYLAHAAELVRSRNAAHDVWGWKDPMAASYIADLNPHLRNPFFIFVTRDPGAVAQRERIEERVTIRHWLLAYIKVASEAYATIASFIAQRARPTLLVSYERALRAPLAAGHAIADFVGVKPPPGFDSWLEGYVSPDRPDASIAALPRAYAAARQFSSTPAVQALIEESLRVRREGFVSGQALDAAGAANKLYTAAVASLNNGEYREAQDRAFAILNVHARQIPALLDGPIGVLAEEAAGGGLEPVYPDPVCGAHYLLGMASLLLTSGRQALIYLTIAERMMRQRLLQRAAGSILSEANYWMCLFHKGVAARAMQRRQVVEEVFRVISLAASDNPPADFALLGRTYLAEAHRRAMAELSIR